MPTYSSDTYDSEDKKQEESPFLMNIWSNASTMISKGKDEISWWIKETNISLPSGLITNEDERGAREDGLGHITW